MDRNGLAVHDRFPQSACGALALVTSVTIAKKPHGIHGSQKYQFISYGALVCSKLLTVAISTAKRLHPAGPPVTAYLCGVTRYGLLSARIPRFRYGPFPYSTILAAWRDGRSLRSMTC